MLWARSIPLYVLTGFLKREPDAVEASLKFFLVGTVSSALMAYGLSFVYGVAGTTLLAGVTKALGTGDPLLMLGLLAVLAGFGFKIAAFPFHQLAQVQGRQRHASGRHPGGDRRACLCSRCVSMEDLCDNGALSREEKLMTVWIEHTVQVWKEGGTYVARAVPLDVMSCGETPDGARENLAEAVDLFLKTAFAHGTLVDVLEESGYVREDDRWRAPKLLLSETVTQSVHA